MDLTLLAVEGSPNPAGRMRLELARAGADGSPLRLALLHDADRPGQYAEVYAARFGKGLLALPLAVKMQRNRADLDDAVAMKFTAEHDTHLRLQSPDGDNHPGRDRIIRMYELWSSTNQRDERLAPAIVCADALHALAPRCPACNRPLDGKHGAGLRCRCGQEAAPDAVRRHVVGKDAACPADCPGKDDPLRCMSSSAFLNTGQRRLLVLERMDLDLRDYLEWTRGGRPGRRPIAAEAFAKHRAALPSPPLRLLVELFADVVQGVEYLHSRHVAHLDLKPANVCLRLSRERVEVKLIDLGLSDDAEQDARVRLTAKWESAPPDDDARLYTAPEVLDMLAKTDHETHTAERIKFNARECVLHWPAERFGRGACEGDELSLRFDDQTILAYRIRRVERLSAHVLLVRGRASADFDLDEEHSGRADVTLRSTAGRAADVFSLGMLLLDLVAGKEAAAAWRARRDDATAWLRKNGAADLPPRYAAARLAGLDAGLARALRGDAPDEAVRDQLLGLVLRATTRGIEGFSYCRDRGSDDGLVAFRKDLDAVRRHLETLEMQQRWLARARDHRAAVLAGLTSWALGRSSAGDAAGAGRDYDRPRLALTLDLCTTDGVADPANAREAEALLRESGGGAELLRRFALLKADLESGIPDDSRDNPLLRRLLRALQLLNSRPESIAALRARTSPGRESALVKRLARFDADRQKLADYFMTMADLFARKKDGREALLLTPEDRREKEDRFNAGYLDSLRLALASFPGETAEWLDERIAELEQVRDEVKARLGAGGPDAATAEQVLNRVASVVRERHEAWADQARAACDEVEDVIAEIQRAVFTRYDREAARQSRGFAGFLARLGRLVGFQAGRYSVSFPEENVLPRRAEEAARLLLELSAGPAAALAAAAALSGPL